MSGHIDIWKGGWQSPEIIPEHGCKNPFQWYLCLIRPRIPERCVKHQKRTEGPLVDNRPTKRVEIKKGSLFDTLPLEILSIIYNWYISFEYNNKLITVMN